MALLLIIFVAMFCVAATIPLWVVYAIVVAVIKGPERLKEERRETPVYGSRNG